MGMPATRDPIEHAAHVERLLREVSRHIDEEVGEVDDERARALFATTERVIDALVESYEDYQRSTAGLWRDGAAADPPE